MVDLLEILPTSQRAILWLMWWASQHTTVQLHKDDLVQALNGSAMSQAVFPTSYKPVEVLTRAVIQAMTFLRQPQANCLSWDQSQLQLTEIGQQTAARIVPGPTWETVAQQVISCAEIRVKYTARSERVESPLVTGNASARRRRR